MAWRGRVVCQWATGPAPDATRKSKARARLLLFATAEGVDSARGGAACTHHCHRTVAAPSSSNVTAQEGGARHTRHGHGGRPNVCVVRPARRRGAAGAVRPGGKGAAGLAWRGGRATATSKSAASRPRQSQHRALHKGGACAAPRASARGAQPTHEANAARGRGARMAHGVDRGQPTAQSARPDDGDGGAMANGCTSRASV